MRQSRFIAIVVGLIALAAWGCGSKTVAPVPLPPLSSVTVSPDADTVRVGENVAFTAAAFDTLGAMVGGAGFKWVSLDTGIFTVSSTGTVRGVSEGTALLIASAGGMSDTAEVTVIPAVDGWYTQASNANLANLYGVFFQADGRDGWAVGEAGKILVTRNAGETWSAQVSRTGFTLYGVWFTSALEGWAVGVNGTVMHTLDGGTLWSRVDTFTSETLMDVQFASRDTGWVVGGNGLVMHTFDRGVTWTKTYPTPWALHSVAFSGTTDGWAVGDGVIVGTHDRGLSWFVVQPTLTSLSLRGIVRRSEVQSVAVGQQGTVAATVAGVDSTEWVLGSAGSAFQLEGVHFPTDMKGWAVGFSGTGTVLHSDDWGASWTTQISNTQFRLNDVFFVDEQRGWAVGDQGTIIHTATGGTP